MRERRIALVGYGAIAQDVCGLLRSAAGRYHLGVLRRAASRDLPAGVERLADDAALAAFRPEIVVEAAGHAAVADRLAAPLARGCTVVVSSAGVLQDDALRARLVGAAQAGGGRIVVPSGALGALDYVAAARGAPGLTVRYESRKPPAAWADELAAAGLDPATLDREVVLFDGSAREAAARYPANLNVAATLALAGEGFDRTQVRVVVDPRARGNGHAVACESALGSMRYEAVNAPSPANPRSSMLVARSIVAAVERHFTVLVVL